MAASVNDGVVAFGAGGGLDDDAPQPHRMGCQEELQEEAAPDAATGLEVVFLVRRVEPKVAQVRRISGDGQPLTIRGVPDPFDHRFRTEGRTICWAVAVAVVALLWPSWLCPSQLSSLPACVGWLVRGVLVLVGAFNLAYAGNAAKKLLAATSWYLATGHKEDIVVPRTVFHVAIVAVYAVDKWLYAWEAILRSWRPLVSRAGRWLAAGLLVVLLVVAVAAVIVLGRQAMPTSTPVSLSANESSTIPSPAPPPLHVPLSATTTKAHHSDEAATEPPEQESTPGDVPAASQPPATPQSKPQADKASALSYSWKWCKVLFWSTLVVVALVCGLEKYGWRPPVVMRSILPLFVSSGWALRPLFPSWCLGRRRRRVYSPTDHTVPPPKQQLSGSPGSRQLVLSSGWAWSSSGLSYWRCVLGCVRAAGSLHLTHM
ncbi:unnamed protein product [Vitrella brassicaformis CCMP3155]|uniref:Uncharacterized protein n=1 Tax=Vitrella brassicaformis (strain CCMP3155) TaxID=1169540 RepID=A0A0G4ES03_VITBC|nr:unnamed protein product [Vitrella brassicaformis CCMP3155]|eukprot:CEM00682.1 unnamed protein product [Vitrella brassicaformis CCMP3155]